MLRGTRPPLADSHYANLTRLTRMLPREKRTLSQRMPMPAPEELGSLDTRNWENLQTLADSLEEAWKKGTPVDLAQLLPPAGTPARAAILHELIKTDLEWRWRQGQGAPLDYYLERFP